MNKTLTSAVLRRAAIRQGCSRWRWPLSSDLLRSYCSTTTTSQKAKDSSNNASHPPLPPPPRLVSILDDLHLIEQIPLQDVRNFCFIAHIDHGKSSLSSRILELTGNLGATEQAAAYQIALQHEKDKNKSDSSGSDDNHHSESEAGRTDAAVGTSTSASSAATATAAATTSTGNKERINLLDTLAVEQQRGITVKASTATMLYRHPAAVGPTGTLLLNMFDTPGHVDFGREVSRSLSFVQGAVLLLDASQGIQAQTWSVHEKVKAMVNPPKLLIALTKVDLPSARPLHVALTVSEWLQYDDVDAILYTSARNRMGVKDVLDAVGWHVQAPTPLLDNVPTNAAKSDAAIATADDAGAVLRAQVVDSWYDARGVNCLVQIAAGTLKEGDRISIVNRTSGSGSSTQSQSTAQPAAASQSFPVQEVGIVLPTTHRTGQLRRGQLGYVRFGLRDPRQAMPGTVLVWTSHANKKDLVLPSQFLDDATATKSVLYASVHPSDADSFEELSNAVDRLALNDTGLEVSKTSSIGTGNLGGPFLGPGLRVGFQGLLHVEVFRQRLHDEFGIEAVVTPPKVPYSITWMAGKKNATGEDVTKLVEDLADWPEAGTKYRVKEPIVDCRIIARVEDAGSVMELISRKRGTEIRTKPIDEEKWLFTARIPWAEVVTDFHDQLKNVTAGYGSMDTMEADPPLAEASLSKVDIVLNGEVVPPLAFVCHKDMAHGESKAVCKKLKEVLPRQQFVTVIQAKADGKIVASERIQAYRKDVLTKSGKTVGGGDQTRKMKLLEKQKQGKKRMQTTGKVTLSQAAFNSVITRSS